MPSRSQAERTQVRVRGKRLVRKTPDTLPPEAVVMRNPIAVMLAIPAEQTDLPMDMWFSISIESDVG